MTREELIAEREELGDKLAIALGLLDEILERLNADPAPKRKAKKSGKKS
jgi:hypothetical protein